MYLLWQAIKLTFMFASIIFTPWSLYPSSARVLLKLKLTNLKIADCWYLGIFQHSMCLIVETKLIRYREECFGCFDNLLLLLGLDKERFVDHWSDWAWPAGCRDLHPNRAGLPTSCQPRLAGRWCSFDTGIRQFGCLMFGRHGWWKFFMYYCCIWKSYFRTLKCGSQCFSFNLTKKLFAKLPFKGDLTMHLIGAYIFKPNYSLTFRIDKFDKNYMTLIAAFCFSNPD